MNDVAIIVCAENKEYIKKAELLAKHLGLKLAEEMPNKCHAALCMGSDGLELLGGAVSIRGDFTRLLPRTKANNLAAELLIKASKPKSFDASPTAVDATAGLGEDSFLLAAAGFRVTLYEFNPIIAALLADALERAKSAPDTAEIAERMTLFEDNSITALKNLSFSPDLVLLDPMFPKRQKSSLVKKKLQMIQSLEMPCSDEDELINAALTSKPKKIVIKRPAKGPFLAGIKPSYSIEGKSIRYDVITPQR